MGYEFDFGVLIEYKGLLIQGLITTIKLSILGIFFSFLIGSIVGIGRASKNFWLSLIASYYVESFRNIPLIVQMFFIYFTFTLSQIFPFLNSWGEFLHIQDVDAFFSALLALILYTGAYIGEVVKAGITSIPKGQFEAAGSLGMNRFQVMWYIIYPQAIRIIIADQKATTSYLQRRLKIGYNKAASLIEELENRGIIGPMTNAGGKREIFVDQDYFN